MMRDFTAFTAFRGQKTELSSRPCQYHLNWKKNEIYLAELSLVSSIFLNTLDKVNNLVVKHCLLLLTSA